MRTLLSQRKHIIAGLLSALVVAAYFSMSHRPRVLAVSEVPVAFWSWRTRAPLHVEVQKAFSATGARALFLRAGQFDIVDGSVERVRPVSGVLPASVELHLVYNGTRKFLHDWDRLEPAAIAAAVAGAFRSDILRASGEHVLITGLQLDFDVPDRMLPRYAEVLDGLRDLIPNVTKLSITGLPGWAALNAIEGVLNKVDFWIPQCYGAEVPTRVSQRTPISSPGEVGTTISRVRSLGKPFYAGLSAYGYAILYDNEGSLIELRGDIDPAWAAHETGLELTGKRAFEGPEHESETRYDYHAKSDVIIDGLIVRTGETLVFDVPSAGSLRAAVRAVRENAGDMLLGICLFRLPMADDRTTLTIGEIAAAVADKQVAAATSITLKSGADGRVDLTAENTGTAAAQHGAGAMTIDVTFTAGSLRDITARTGFSTVETLCVHGAAEPRPCSMRRANVVRLKASAWSPGNTANVTADLTELPPLISAVVRTRLGDGQMETQTHKLQVGGTETK